MTNIDDDIRKTVGGENPFRVPDGYFGQFADRLMSQLPEQPVLQEPQLKRASMSIWRPRYWAAACVCALVSATAFYFTLHEADMTASAEAEVSGSSYEEQVADCAMMDNADIYAYLCSAE